MPYLRNSTAYDHGFWYTCVKSWYLHAFFFFFFFFNFFFWGFLGGKRAKSSPKWQKKSVCHTSYLINHTSYVCHLWCTSVKWQYLQAFFHFLKILIFRVVKRAKEQKTVGWWKGKKWSKMTKNSVLYASYLRNHASYDCHLWYTCVNS